MSEQSKSGISNWRAWSTIRKAQIIAAVIGALVTLIMTYGTYLPHVLFPGVPPESPLPDFLFWLYLVLYAPTYHLCTLFGIAQGNWLLGPLEIVVNTSLCFLFGTILGLVLNALKKAKK